MVVTFILPFSVPRNALLAARKGPRDIDWLASTGVKFRVPPPFQQESNPYQSPLVFDEGRGVETARQWQRRRAEILSTWHQLLGHQNRVAMTNRETHGPTKESNEQIYRFFQWWLTEQADP
ncbi:MAG: hypothetical protein ACODAD_12885 [Planctomycetota bacterium]